MAEEAGRVFEIAAHLHLHDRVVNLKGLSINVFTRSPGIL